MEMKLYCQSYTFLNVMMPFKLSFQNSSEHVGIATSGQVGTAEPQERGHLPNIAWVALGSTKLSSVLVRTKHGVCGWVHSNQPPSLALSAKLLIGGGCGGEKGYI